MITPKDFEETAFALVALYKDGVMTDAFFGKAENGSELVLRSASEYDELRIIPVSSLSQRRLLRKATVVR